MKKWRLALLLFLLPLSLEAMNGMSPIGYGVKSKGMGGVAVALPLDSFVVATNPAGIVDLGCRVDGELSYAFQSLKYKESGALTLDSKSNRGLWWPGIGLTASLSPSSSIGIAAYTLGVTDTQWSTALPLVGNPPNNSPFVNTSLQSYFLAISPSLAWRFCANHSFGIAANIIVGTMNIKGASLFTSSTVNASFLNNNGVDTAIGGSIRIGWLGKFLCNRLHLGASISSRSYMSRFSKYQGFFPSYGQFNWPWSGELGFAWLFRPCWTFSFDYRYLAWKSKLGHEFHQLGDQ